MIDNFATTLAGLLRTLATARGTQRGAEYLFRSTEAYAETRATEHFRAGGELGKNAEDRARQLIVALDRDVEFRQAQRSLWNAQDDVRRLEAEVEILHAQRREREQDIRERLMILAEQGRLPAVI